jgi:signal transduction histidine kinase
MLRAAPRRAAVSRSTLLALAATGVTLLGWYVVVLGVRDSAAMRLEVPELGRNITAGLFITAGMARLASWRMTRDWDAAAAAAALLALGASLSAATLLATTFSDGSVVPIEVPEGDALVFIPLCVLALFLGMRNRQRLATTGVIMIGTAAAVAGLATVLPGAPSADQHLTVLWVAVEAMTAAAWTGLAYLAWTRRRLGGQTVMMSWAVAAGLLMAGRAVLRMWSLVDARTLHGLAGGLGLCAAAIMLVTAMRTLHGQVRQRMLDDELGRILLLRNDQVDELERRQRARLHDARSVVLGVKGASTLLARQGGAPDGLDAILAAELDRLDALLGSEVEPRPCGEFSVRDAVLPVLTTHRLAGVKIHEVIEPVHAIGRATETATVVDNLLRNAARHAPGANVHVSVRRVGEEVEIVVADDGPGIPPVDRARMLLPGVRGVDAPAGGSGLGLYNSLCAMSAQNGSLLIGGRRHGGTRIVIGLPAAIACAADVRIAS